MRNLIGDKARIVEDRGVSIIEMDVGLSVVCDLCNKDYTSSKREGGCIFFSNAICPDCIEEFLLGVKQYGEEQYIRAQCPEGVSFRDFVINYRDERR